VRPTAAQTFLFADGVHPTTAAHRILSDFVIGVIGRRGRSRRCRRRRSRRARCTWVKSTPLAQQAWLRAQAGTNVWATVNGQRVKFDSSGTSPETQGDGAGLTIWRRLSPGGRRPWVSPGGLVSHRHGTSACSTASIRMLRPQPICTRISRRRSKSRFQSRGQAREVSRSDYSFNLASISASAASQSSSSAPGKKPRFSAMK
jgi:hypothetical protein